MKSQVHLKECKIRINHVRINRTQPVLMMCLWYFLQSFIAKFKTAELSASNKKLKAVNVLTPLLYETFDPFDTTKYVQGNYIREV